ncbi:hypothetical protein COCNU_scaffold005159G000010 [Cocos nucifera]|nr:hypothetical protein [Cocos nucifera]
MEATTGATSFLDSRLAFPPATAAEKVRTLCVAGRRRAGSISWARRVVASALEKRAGNGGKKAGDAVPNSNYVVPLDKASCLTRPLAEILRDLNKRVPEKIIHTANNSIPCEYLKGRGNVGVTLPGSVGCKYYESGKSKVYYNWDLETERKS